MEVEPGKPRGKSLGAFIHKSFTASKYFFATIFSFSWRKIKTGAKSTFDALGPYENRIIAIATLALAIFTAIATTISIVALILARNTESSQHADNLAYLAQSQQAEENQLRAYVSITSDALALNNASPSSELPYVINYTLKNDGLTPARNVHITTSLITDSGNPVLGYNNSSFISPGESVYEADALPTSTLLATSNTDNYLQISVQFLDFNNQSHTYIFQMQLEENSHGILSALNTINATEN
jgi:hypothetical protein